jgi:hypothetical protein
MSQDEEEYIDEEGEECCDGEEDNGYEDMSEEIDEPEEEEL